MNFLLVDVCLHYNDAPDEPKEELCAIGKYDETSEECRNLDESIFYWFESKEELEKFNEEEGNEFTVTGYTYRPEPQK